jgi:hypothetical protein
VRTRGPAILASRLTTSCGSARSADLVRGLRRRWSPFGSLYMPIPFSCWRVTLFLGRRGRRTGRYRCFHVTQFPPQLHEVGDGVKRDQRRQWCRNVVSAINRTGRTGGTHRTGGRGGGRTRGCQGAGDDQLIKWSLADSRRPLIHARAAHLPASLTDRRGEPRGRSHSVSAPGAMAWECPPLGVRDMSPLQLRSVGHDHSSWNKALAAILGLVATGLGVSYVAQQRSCR